MERTGGVVEAVRMSELFVGLAQLVTEMQGKDSDPIAQNSIAELITCRDAADVAFDYACQAFREHRAGHGVPQYAGDQCGQVLLRR